MHDSSAPNAEPHDVPHDVPHGMQDSSAHESPHGAPHGMRDSSAHESAHGARVDPHTPWAEPHWEILRLRAWCGYGQALKAGLELVDTELVLVIQHDYAFLRPTDLGPIARTMLASAAAAACSTVGPAVAAPVINYVALLKKAQLQYQDAIRSRSGLRVHERRITVPPHHRPTASSTPLPAATMKGSAPAAPVGNELRLLELPQLYDSTHLARTGWYLDRFDETHLHLGQHGQHLGQHGDGGSMEGIPRGQFPEDILSAHMLRQAKTEGVAAVIRRYGTYLCTGVGDKVGVLAIAHIDGRRFRDHEQRVAKGWPEHHPRYWPNQQ